MRFDYLLIVGLLGLSGAVAQELDTDYGYNWNNYKSLEYAKEQRIRLVNERWLPWFGRPIDK